MVARVGCYYGELFKGSRGGTYTKLLSTTISNMVVEVFIHNWATVVARENVGTEGSGRAVQNMVALFYVYNRFLTYLLMARLQEDLDFLEGQFNRVGLQTNIEKTFGMVYQKFRTMGIQLEEAYI